MTKRINKHIPVMLNNIKQYIPDDRKINVIDATFGGGGYSKFILNRYDVNKLIAIDRDDSVKIYAKKLEKNFPKTFKLLIGRFSKIDELVFQFKDKIFFDLIIYDLGLSSNQLEDPKRGFSFDYSGPLDMNMGFSNISALNVINDFSEKEISDILFNYGQERYAKKIAKTIIKKRKIIPINTTKQLQDIIKSCVPYSKKVKINPATRSFQAIRIYVNDELNELKKSLEKAENLLSDKGRIIVVSFQSLEDKIVKDYFNRKSGKKWRSSRHYPELVEKGPITLKNLTNKPIRPDIEEINLNSRCRSAKLRVAEKLVFEERL
ncbi:MAG: Ribosomal RNA small subunit methyltransferase H [Alphaproteobacteria bacterium MarineAlpha5_Bin9]|nr:MAG: Ribosomal RNA small subunit methyltransferase H [Alphaproteobacteria bacterium MarineAlpha5_Bin9]|tara:strand:- start:16226 stop:17185 length:960 start_codon:yes stop_codon:yes gene_type:complete